MRSGAILEALASEPDFPLRPFHRRWIRAAYASGVQVAALSCPRGSGKTWLAGRLAALAMRPDSPTWEEGVEVLAVAASMEQARILFSVVKASLADVKGDYVWTDSSTKIRFRHKATGTALRILSSSGKRAMGLANFSTIFADEPASWEIRGGALMYDALRQSLGKRPGQRLFLIGTRSPADPGTWWPDLLDGGDGDGIRVMDLASPPEEPWDGWLTLVRANPMVLANPSLRRTVLREREQARRNPTMRRSYEAYRLNREVNVTAESLISVDDWNRVLARPVPPRKGFPIVAVDMGGERSWSAAWCLWENGRSECYAVVPGVPGLAVRERADAMPRGLYLQLAEDGVLVVQPGVRVSDPAFLMAHLISRGIRPISVWCDRFVVGALQDAVAGRWPLHIRRTRWSEATEDIAAFRRIALDGPLSLIPSCRKLASVSIGQATVAGDSQGSARIKKSRHGRSRDDVAVAGVLASGVYVRTANRGGRLRVAVA